MDIMQTTSPQEKHLICLLLVFFVFDVIAIVAFIGCNWFISPNEISNLYFKQLAMLFVIDLHPLPNHQLETTFLCDKANTS